MGIDINVVLSTEEVRLVTCDREVRPFDRLFNLCVGVIKSRREILVEELVETLKQ